MNFVFDVLDFFHDKHTPQEIGELVNSLDYEKPIRTSKGKKSCLDYVRLTIIDLAKENRLQELYDYLFILSEFSGYYCNTRKRLVELDSKIDHTEMVIQAANDALEWGSVTRLVEEQDEYKREKKQIIAIHNQLVENTL